MLVLTRKVGESIVIADNIRITVVDVGNGRVRVGVEAQFQPHGVLGHRFERGDFGAAPGHGVKQDF